MISQAGKKAFPGGFSFGGISQKEEILTAPFFCDPEMFC
jgi:hypothetical protein